MIHHVTAWKGARSRRLSLERLEERQLLAIDPLSASVDRLTLTVADVTIQSDPVTAKSGWTDVYFSVPSGSQAKLAGYNAALDVSPTTAGISLTGVATPANPVFPGRTPGLYGTGDRLLVFDYLPGVGQENLIADGQGLFRAQISVPAGVSGTFALTLSGVELVNSVPSSIPVDVVGGTLTVVMAPAASISDVIVTEGDEGSVNAVFTVSLSGPTDQTVTIDYASADGTARAGADYEQRSGQIMFSPGQTIQTIAVPVLGDLLDEPNETFFVNLSNPSHATIADGQGVATILDNDGAPSLSIGNATINPEGDSGTKSATLTVVLSGTSGQVVTVHYATADGTAVAAADYVATSGDLTFAPGVTSQTVIVPVLGDTLDEEDELYVVNLSGAVNAEIGGGRGEVTIVDDDPAPVVSIADASVLESDGGEVNLVFTVTLSAASGKTIAVDFATSDGDAVAGADYRAHSGTLDFPPGTTALTVAVSVVGDTLNESDESFFIELSAPVNATVGDGRAEGKILDNDEPSHLVHLLYLVPSNREVRPEAVADLRYAVLQYQSWYRDQMERYGLGAKSFSVETEADGTTPRVYVVQASQPDSYFREDPWGRVTQAAVAAGLPIGAPGEVWLETYEGLDMNADGSLDGVIALGSSSGSGDDPGVALKDRHPLMSSEALLDDRLYDQLVITALGPYPLVQDVSASWADGTTVSTVSSANFGTLLHELSHAFGLSHDFRSDENFNGDVMGNGARGFRGWFRSDLYPDDDVRLSYAGALALSTSRYFRDDQSYTDNTAPTVTVATSGLTSLVQGALEIHFSASDTSGLSAAILQLDGQTVAERPLVGGNVNTAISTPFYKPGQENAFTLLVYDTAGNRRDVEVAVTPATGSDRAPQPFLTVSHSRLLVGENVLLDASQTLDPDGRADDLRFEWDLDNDGLFEVISSPNKTLAASFAAEGSYLVRVRVTDAEGGQGVSPPLALRVVPAPLLTVGDLVVAEGDSNTVVARFNLGLSMASERTVTVRYATVDGTATSGSDYEAASGIVTFTPGSTSQTVAIAVIGDTLDEADEEFFLSLWEAENATIADPQAKATISDDDPLPSLLIGDLTVTEGDTAAVSAVFTVSLSAASGRPVTVHYATADQTATTPADYTATAGQLTFAPGQTAQTITVLVRGDARNELAETFLVNLSGPVNATIADGQAIGTIVDNDPPPSVTLSLTGSPLSESGGTAVVVATLSAVSGRDVTVTLAFSGTASAGSDYTRSNTVISIPAGSVSGSITLVACEDAMDEADETIVVSVESVTHGTAAGMQQVIATIADNDDPPAASINDIVVTEGSSGTISATLTVTLSAPSGQVVTVDYSTADRSATSPADYEAASGRLTFATGQTTQSITVIVKGDTLDEANEVFLVNLDGAMGAVLADAEGTVTITDDDAAPSLSINDVTITEGNNGTLVAQFVVTLSPASGQTVTVAYATADQTARAPADYAAAGGELAFAPGVTSQIITVVVQCDVLDEADETFLVNLFDPAGAIIADGQGVGTIVDDDPAPILSIGDVSVTEASAGTVSAVFTVTLSAASGQVVSVAYTTEDQSAESPADYAAASGHLAFAAGQTTQSIVVVVKGDSLDEADETFLVRLLSPIGATLGVDVGVGIIVDVDAAPALSISDVTIAEGNVETVNATFTVSLSAASGRTVTVDYATADQSAQAGWDYLAATGRLTFAPGQTVQSITVAVRGDWLDEIDEHFVVNLSNPTNATIADGQAEGTIVDDDAAPALSVHDVTVFEKDSGTSNAFFTVTLSAPSGQTVSVNYATADQTATAPSDYTAVDGQLIFSPGEIVQIVRVAVKGDLLGEADETFLVNIQAASNATIRRGAAVGTILDNDGETGSLSGWVYVDADNDGTRANPSGGYDFGIGGVTIRLRRTDVADFGERVRVTNEDGSYSFDHLAPGTYEIVEDQLPAVTDGPESLGIVNGVANGIAGEDRFWNIVLGAGEAGVNYAFGERMSSPPRDAAAANALSPNVVYGNADSVALYDPATSSFHFRNTNTRGLADVVAAFGSPGGAWLPVAGDWNGDGLDTIGLYDPVTSVFHFRNSNSTGVAEFVVGFGLPGAGWLPLAGDWDGDGIDTPGLYDPATHLFYLRNGLSTGSADLTFVCAGTMGTCKPIAGDWDKDGRTTVGLFDAASQTFLLANANAASASLTTLAFTVASGVPVAGDWNGNGAASVGGYGTVDSTFHLINANQSDSPTIDFGFGVAAAGWLPIAGRWTDHGGWASLVAETAPCSSGRAASLSLADAQRALQAAFSLWNAKGMPAGPLVDPDNVRLSVADLPGAELGRARGNEIVIDRDAAGYGWFIDPTPWADEEYFAQADGLERAILPEAVDHIDLETVVLHELGHLAGLDDSASPSDVMHGSLGAGWRRMTSGDV